MTSEEPKLFAFQTSEPGPDDTQDEDQTINETQPLDEDIDVEDQDQNQDLHQTKDQDEDLTQEEISKDQVQEDELPQQEEDNAPTNLLQISKIKKIFKTDPEHVSATNASVLATGIATECFIQYFTEQAYLIARADKRRKLQYKDFASAVSNIEQLYFLSDIVPKTHTLESLIQEDKIKYKNKEHELEKGQTTLKFGKNQQTKTSSEPEDEEDDLPESDVEEVNHDEVEDRIIDELDKIDTHEEDEEETDNEDTDSKSDKTEDQTQNSDDADVVMGE
ncbi:hypothetical protein WICMUC_005982 [Wickerhamomyces mucosus]|uniref:Transcription factor CBF/NF-Y/archaeal histone domain-containing protein n=1 Tax=Wickerhamomyces mucosus TaxID=1378264 RepID=A0A9P8T354_9ASCO|nr:hypothetical protein WICMUC_005982 [Wickerhamomyces mucosus]